MCAIATLADVNTIDAYGHPADLPGNTYEAIRRAAIAYPEAPVEQALDRLGIAPAARPENLSKEQYVDLTAQIKAHICHTVCES